MRYKIYSQCFFQVLEEDEEQFTTDAAPLNEEYEEYGRIFYFNLINKVIQL